MDDSGERPSDVVPPSRPTGGSARFWLAALVVAAIPPILACAGVFYFFRLSVPPLTEDSLQTAMDRWDEQGPASYVMELDIGGARPGNVYVEVKDNQVIAMRRDGRQPTEPRTWGVWSVPGMFETLERELDLAADPVGQMGAPTGTEILIRAQFDPAYGYPARFQRLVRGEAPEASWAVTKFEATSP